MKFLKHLVLLAVFGASLANVAAESIVFPEGGQAVTSKHHHLGAQPMEGWPEVSPQPEAERLDVHLKVKRNATEWVLAIRQRDVTERCVLRINGATIATINPDVDPRVFFYPLPPGTMKDGENVVSIVPARTRDNMVIGPIRLYEKSVRELLRMQSVSVTVSDAANGKAVPARLTITDSNNLPVELFNVQTNRTALRVGTLYTLGTETNFDLPEGEYKFYATRGMEWSRAEKEVPVRLSKSAIRIPLVIRREVDTAGFIAADTHVHTLTFSGHGDANLNERVLTLAGEGVELAIATDHNHNTDYRPNQKKLGLNEFFTSVTGNEVSTTLGHMNGFPLNPKDSPPNHKLGDWVQLVDGIRAKGAKVVILNHPRSPVIATSPFTRAGLNRASGEFGNGTRFPFDAMELTNPGGARPDPLYVFRDWFSLLNHGEKVTAIGSSDSHTVDDAVGWGRTYVPSATDDPARIDVDDACDRFLRGETSVALGIFTDIRVDGEHRMGQTVSSTKSSVDVRLRVAAPSWVHPRRAIVYLNGQPVMEKPVPITTNQPTDLWLEFTVPLSKHDAHLVCVVLGDGVDHLSIGTKARKIGDKVQRINTFFTLAATNPIFLDVDGNGKYESPREQARRLLDRSAGDLDKQWKTIMATDEVLAVQMVSLLRQETNIDSRPTLDQRIREAAAERKLLAEYALHALPHVRAETIEGE
ncbi:MAG: CehA/McbA family metallohydrolase [Verrucomicrobia bacterium]|nr:CehA/McbA family metallohydrolase [Verrucomicrobiota bacterium]